MNLPEELLNAQSWTLVGPMGPRLPLSLSDHAVLAVDGGAKFAPKIDFWVGDHDSLAGKVESTLRWDLPQDKEASDLAFALSTLSKAVASEFHLWGFLGGRKDHELFNLGECSRFLMNREQTTAHFYDQSGKILITFFSRGKWEINHQGLFSLSCLGPTTVELRGPKYPLAPGILLEPLSSFGLSNHSSGKLYLYPQGPVFLTFPEVK
jgi:thiamine pyrophosphokinase